MQNFIAQKMRSAGLAPKNKVVPVSPNGGNATKVTNEPLAHMNVEGKYAYSSLSYPLDLQSRTDLGHYMMFYVNVPNNTEYSTTNTFDKTPKNQSSSEKRSGQTDAQLALIDNEKAYSKNTGAAGSFNKEGRSWKAGETEKVMYRTPHKGTLPNQTKRTNDAITLYMPNTGITSQYAAKWEAGKMGADVGDAAGKVKAGMAGGFAGQISGFMEQAALKIEKMGTSMAGALAGGDLQGTVDKLSNRAENEFLETFFKGLDLRKFQFTWQFRPKSPKETYEVQKIIKTFKFHSMPEFPGGNVSGRFYTVPATWDIFYMYRGDENQWINKIATCVIGNVSINYSPTAWQTFRPLAEDGYPSGAPPTEIDMALDFMETRVITKQDILDGF